MPPTKAQVGYGTLLGRQETPNLTTIAAAITGSTSPQVVTPAAMTNIVVGSILAIDSQLAGVAPPKEIVQVSAVTGTTFTAIILNNHGVNSQVSRMITLAEIIKMAGPNGKLDMKEATNMLSPNTYKEFIAGLRDGGTISFEGNYLPKDPTQANIRADFDAAVASVWSITLPNDPLTLLSMGIWCIQAFPQDITPSLPLDDRMTFTGTLRITGKPILV